MIITTLAVAAAVAVAGGQERAPQDGLQLRASPRGSYSATCNNDYVNQGRLYADCRDDRGRLRGTSIRLDQCGPYDVANADGRLVCGPYRGDFEDRGGRPDPVPPRPDPRPDPRPPVFGVRGITIYRDANYSGPSTTLRGEIPNLSRDLNDTISSLEANGEWEVCTDSYFRGQCQIVSGGVRNLARTGLNDRISSLRPVGPRRAY